MQLPYFFTNHPHCCYLSVGLVKSCLKTKKHKAHTCSMLHQIVSSLFLVSIVQHTFNFIHLQEQCKFSIQDENYLLNNCGKKNKANHFDLNILMTNNSLVSQKVYLQRMLYIIHHRANMWNSGLCRRIKNHLHAIGISIGMSKRIGIGMNMWKNIGIGIGSEWSRYRYRLISAYIGLYRYDIG